MTLEVLKSASCMLWLEDKYHEEIPGVPEPPPPPPVHGEVRRLSSMPANFGRLLGGASGTFPAAGSIGEEGGGHVPRLHGICFYYKGPRGCFRGAGCPYSHGEFDRHVVVEPQTAVVSGEASALLAAAAGTTAAPTAAAAEEGAASGSGGSSVAAARAAAVAAAAAKEQARELQDAFHLMMARLPSQGKRPLGEGVSKEELIARGKENLEGQYALVAENLRSKFAEAQQQGKTLAALGAGSVGGAGLNRASPPPGTTANRPTVGASAPPVGTEAAHSTELPKPKARYGRGKAKFCKKPCQICDALKAFAASEDTTQHFALTKEARMHMHFVVAGEFHAQLESKSHGEGEARTLVVSKVQLLPAATAASEPQQPQP
jgi:hypothetical protein